MPPRGKERGITEWTRVGWVKKDDQGKPVVKGATPRPQSPTVAEALARSRGASAKAGARASTRKQAAEFRAKKGTPRERKLDLMRRIFEASRRPEGRPACLICSTGRTASKRARV